MKMKTQNSNGAAFANESVDAFLSVAGIYLDSSQRLAELTLAANRQALDDLVEKCKKPETGMELMSGQFDGALTQPMFARAVTYSRNVMEVLTQAQLDAGRAMGQHLIPRFIAFPTSDEWTAGVESVSEGIREFSERSAAAMVAATESQAHRVTEAAARAAKAS